MKVFTPLRLLVSGLAIIYLLIPLLVTIPASFTHASYPSFPPHGFSFRWYTILLHRPEFVSGFIKSVEIASMAALISTVLGTMAAWAIAKYEIPGKTWLVNFLTSPLTVPQLVLGIALLIFFTPFALLSGTMTGFLLAHTVVCVPYVVRFVVTGLSGFDYTLERAAMILGARPATVFWKVTLPVIRPAILSGALFAFLTSFDNVTISLFLMTPDMHTLPIEIFSHMLDAYDPIVASVSSVVIVISVLMIIALERLQGLGRVIGRSH